MLSIYFGEDHHQFRQSLRTFLETEVKTELWEEEKSIPREIWKQMGALGYLGINFPEEYGGSNADFFYSVIFLEEISRMGSGGFSAAVGVQEYMATAHLFKHGTEALKQRYLVPSITGDKIGALAISEPDVGSDVANLRTRAVRDGDDFVVNGSKIFITNGVRGDFVTLAVRTGEEGSGGISLLIVDQNTPGFSASPLKKMGWHCSDTGVLTFEDVRVPASQLIGQENMGFYYIMEAFQLERLVAALTSIGGSERGLEITLDYVKSREAFGRTVSRFQVIRHRLADLSTRLEAARQLTYHACWLYSQGQHAVKECSMAKLEATELSTVIADACLQCFGGYGFMDEYPISRMYRDARVGTIVGGTSEIMREIIAKIIIDGVKYEAPASGEGQKQVVSDSLDEIRTIFSGLPARFKGDSSLKGLVHFDFQQDGCGLYSVALKDGLCSVEEGLVGSPDCVVTTAGAVYRDIETGKQSPEAAFMSGLIQVSNIVVMMQFMAGFKKMDGD